MQNTELSNKFKDEHPSNTVSRIRAKLHQLNINIIEQSWNNINDSCYSVRIEIDGLNGVGTNGKGTTRTYAIASAYAELMERLQNRKILSKIYCNKPKLEISFPDEKLCSNEELVYYEPILKGILVDYNRQKFKELINTHKSLSFCEPYFNVKNQKVDYLPSRIINLACGTNGMCAGNTKEEALVGGICEVMERFVMKQIILKDLVLPTIPNNSVKNLRIFNLISLLENEGYTVIIKDCSMNGRFPVMGVLVINESCTKYHFKLGSFPVLDIAIERCLTEMFQGDNLDTKTNFQYINFNISNYTIDEKLELIRQNAVSRGQFPNSIFENRGVNENFINAFLPDLKENKTGLDHLLRIIQKENLELFIRDVSFLDFPTYKIYIPTISELLELSIESIKAKFVNAEAEKDILNLKDSTNEQLVNITKYLTRSLLKGCDTLSHANILRRVNLNINCRLKNLDINFFLTLIYIKLNDYGKAFNHLKNYINTNLKYKKSALKYYICVLKYLKYKNENIDECSIKTNLISLFGNKIAIEVIHDLENNTVFRHIPTVNAPNCEECDISENCNFSAWKRTTNTIIKKMEENFPNQNDINVSFPND